MLKIFLESDTKHEGHIRSSCRWNKRGGNNRNWSHSRGNRREVLKKRDLRCSPDTSGSDRKEWAPRSALIQIDQESSTGQIHASIPQYRRAEGKIYSLLASH